MKVKKIIKSALEHQKQIWLFYRLTWSVFLTELFFAFKFYQQSFYISNDCMGNLTVMAMALGEAARTEYMFNLRIIQPYSWSKTVVFCTWALKRPIQDPIKYTVFITVFFFLRKQLTLSFPVTRCAGHNIDLPSNSIILKMV